MASYRTLLWICHSSTGSTVAPMINFGGDKDSVSYFILDDAHNNNTAVTSLADLYGFETQERRLRLCLSC
jgi:hypothetical protein